MKKNISLTKDKRNGNWIAYFYINGKQQPWSTKCKNKREASKLAEGEYDRRIDGYVSRSRNIKLGSVRFLLEAWDNIAGPGKLIDISDDTKNQSSGALKLMVNASTAKDLGAITRKGVSDESKEIILDADTNIIDGNLFQNYVEWKLANVPVTGDAGIDGPAQQRCRRSCNTQLAKVKMMFQEKAIKAYNQSGQAIPQQWLDFTKKKKVKASKPKYNAPQASLVEKVWQRLTELKQTRPEIYIAFILAACGGMRKGEIRKAMRSWIRPDFSGIDIPEGVAKTGAARFVPLPVDLCKEIYELSVKGWNNDHRDRYNSDLLTGLCAVDYLNDELRVIGFKSQGLLTHALRKYYGAQLASTAGVYVAMRMLGHKDIKTTTGSYADYCHDLEGAPAIDTFIKTGTNTNQPKMLEEEVA